MKPDRVHLGPTGKLFVSREHHRSGSGHRDPPSPPVGKLARVSHLRSRWRTAATRCAEVPVLLRTGSATPKWLVRALPADCGAGAHDATPQENSGQVSKSPGPRSPSIDQPVNGSESTLAAYDEHRQPSLGYSHQNQEFSDHAAELRKYPQVAAGELAPFGCRPHPVFPQVSRSAQSRS
jgi:hypothetical protein